MGLTIKVPVKEIRARRPVAETVEEQLKKDPEHAYSAMGLMVECFGVKESEILSVPWSDWKEGYPALYSRIRTSLERLHNAGKVNKVKQGQPYLYWWKK
jgi:hypothetical protein